ncbi:hypothetical protein PAXRUDRAFT_832373 [Paxillus rubicundulus Ve08.2h10]|uniref:Unplaced genomic scaffold scaffold_848, whole genome shotgun sequence n=1 Tax=Paxillus rubicundulus Ve08.2h10 TaxID=930991 RepID=A0A0D0DD12_9AGAM|nr:hypothetical protein PAXRUDRAFT_832373 [Paxillus rubicundulus Ve08.2h10]
MAEEDDEIVQGSLHDRDSDMQLSDDGSELDTMKDELAMKPEEEGLEDDEQIESEEDEVAEEDTIESEELSPPPSPLPSKPRLKIKLKLPQVLSSNEPSSRAASTPSGQPSQPPSGRAASRDIDIESEDEEDEVAGGSTRPMTSRQAVLASVVYSSHVSLSESSRKKKQLTESEIALRREETARKRKNLSEKKLEDEKAETINRLLKKQSKAKNKRNVWSTADDRTPVSVTPAVVQSAREGSEAPEGEVFEPVQLIPTMYRWTSTTKPLPAAAAEGTEAASQNDSEGKMRLMFSVPVSVLPPEGTAPRASEVKPTPSIKPVCDVSGCQRTRKYRVVKDWMKGACGMEHLKVLEYQMDV